MLLKHGTDTSQGKGHLISNINACNAVVDLVRTTLGPRGLDKLIHEGRGKVTITNDGATIVQLLQIVHPAAKTLVDISMSQDAEVGDGTTSVILLAGEMMNKCKEVRGWCSLCGRLGGLGIQVVPVVRGEWWFGDFRRTDSDLNLRCTTVSGTTLFTGIVRACGGSASESFAAGSLLRTAYTRRFSFGRSVRQASLPTLASGRSRGTSWVRIQPSGGRC